MTKILTTSAITLTFAGIANAATFTANDHSPATQLCMKAASGNLAAFASAVKSSGYSKQFVVYNIKCNDKNITDFVAQHSQSPEKMLKLINQGRHFGKVSITDIAAL